MDKKLIEQAKQEAADAKASKKAEKAYNAASSTPVVPEKKFAKGGSVTRADGCVSKGHTKGKMV